MKRIDTDAIARAKAEFQSALAKAKTETGLAQQAYNNAKSRLDMAQRNQARLEGAVKALEGIS